tara:strand:- start:590 stop:1300 length:711 start_codon:yes stop_codon:yes gene_type:complete
MASWGQAAVGGDRPTGMQPARSALLGLLGAALGIKRDDESALSNLQSSVCFAVKQCAPGALLRDFHSSQVPSQSKKATHFSRRSELSERKLNTVLSSRDYRCDGLWIVAIWLTEQSVLTLEQLQRALLKPVYCLYLGRKSCPPALPLCPKILKASYLKDALDMDFPAITRSEKEDAMWLGMSGYVTYYWEGDRNAIASSDVLTTEPWDQPLHRERWQFTQRDMHQLSIRESDGVFV